MLGQCAFVSTNVIGSYNRDGLRQSRVLQGTWNGWVCVEYIGNGWVCVEYIGNGWVCVEYIGNGWVCVGHKECVECVDCAVWC